MRMPLATRALMLLALADAGPSFAQVAQGVAPPPPPAQVIAAAKEIMHAARYCTLVTIGVGGQPQARIVDAFQPDSDLTIWIATKPLSRKVNEIRLDPRVTLVYFSAPTFEYVTVIGTAVLDTDPVRKAAHWKTEWAGMYKDQNRGDDYVLLRVRPSRLEVVSPGRGMANDPATWLPVILELPH